MPELSPDEKKFRRNLAKRLDSLEEELGLLKVDVRELREIVKEALNEP